MSISLVMRLSIPVHVRKQPCPGVQLMTRTSDRLQARLAWGRGRGGSELSHDSQAKAASAAMQERHGVHGHLQRLLPAEPPHARAQDLICSAALPPDAESQAGCPREVRCSCIQCPNLAVICQLMWSVCPNQTMWLFSHGNEPQALAMTAAAGTHMNVWAAM